MTKSTATIPVVDVSPFFSKSATHAARQAKAKEVAQKCSSNGCLAITGHGIPQELLSESFNLARRLFNLPMGEKMRAPHPSGMVPHRGYSAPGKERAFAKADLDASDIDHQEMLRKTQDWKESYEVGDDSNQKDYNIWLPDDTLPGFRPLSSEIFQRFRRFSTGILEALVMGLDVTEQEQSTMFTKHSGPVGQLRLLHYLEMEVSQRLVEEADRLPAHTDWSSFTLSFQDTTGGLEFEDRKSGAFMPVTPRNDAVYLNIGDMMERFSNGLYPACTHRVVLPSKSRENDDGDNAIQKISERYVLVYFATISDEVLVAPPTSLIEKHGVARFEPVTYSDYAEQRSKWHYEGYTEDS